MNGPLFLKIGMRRGTDWNQAITHQPHALKSSVCACVNLVDNVCLNTWACVCVNAYVRLFDNVGVCVCVCSFFQSHSHAEHTFSLS